jgi:hypothetical protein
MLLQFCLLRSTFSIFFAFSARLTKSERNSDFGLSALTDLVEL